MAPSAPSVTVSVAAESATISEVSAGACCANADEAMSNPTTGRKTRRNIEIMEVALKGVRLRVVGVHDIEHSDTQNGDADNQGDHPALVGPIVRRNWSARLARLDVPEG